MERKGKSKGLRIALVSYDVQELRVWHQYLVEQSPEILCREYRSGEELLQLLRQRGHVDVVVLGSELEDMESMEFLSKLSKLRAKPLVLLQDRRYRPEAAVSAMRPDGACYLIQPSSLQDMVQSLLASRGLPTESPAQFCRRMLTDWGVSPAESAGKYLIDAVTVPEVDEDGRPLALRKQILQAVADQHEMTVAAVDSALRRFVEGCETRNTPAWAKFKKENALNEKKLTAGKLIMTLRTLAKEQCEAARSKEP